MPQTGDVKTPINIRLSAEALVMIERAKQKLGVSRTAVIEMAVRDFCARQELKT